MVRPASCGVERAPQLRCGAAGDHAVTAEVERGCHAPARQGRLTAVKGVDPAVYLPQPPAADPVRQRVASDPGRAQLLQVHVAVLEPGQARDLGVAVSLNRLKRTNCAGQPQSVENGPCLGP